MYLVAGGAAEVASQRSQNGAGESAAAVAQFVRPAYRSRLFYIPAEAAADGPRESAVAQRSGPVCRPQQTLHLDYPL